MTEIIRIWVYKVTYEDLKLPECKISKTNQPVKRVVRGDFEYYEVDGSTAVRTNRKAARIYEKKTGKRVFTLKGYPFWMQKLGFKA